MIELRDYQQRIVDDGRKVLNKLGLIYLAMEVRTGKTFTALFMCNGVSPVLFITKKKAIPSIKADYEASGLNYDLEVVNFESVHKIRADRGWGYIVIDEAHSLGAFPRPSSRAKKIRELVHEAGCPVVFMSGTPTPESYSQIFHQLWVSPKSPFEEERFYKWANKYVDVKKKKVSRNVIVNDYSKAKDDLVKSAIRPYMISFSQKEAGFSGVIKEHILNVKMEDRTYDLIRRLQRDQVIAGKDKAILADTPVKMQSKLHQLYSGTIKFEDGSSMVIDQTKAHFIKAHFEGRKIAIFYKFKAEYTALQSVFGNVLTDSISDFDNDPDAVIALQIQSGREGTKLAAADALIFYNIDFSATSYWQGRDRMTTMDRKFNDVYWIFSENGIEEKVYETVLKKKSYTNYFFKRDFVKKKPIGQAKLFE